MSSSDANAGAVSGLVDFAERCIPLREMPVPGSGVIHAWYLDLGQLAIALRTALDGHHEPDSAAPPLTAGQMRFARRFYLRLLVGAYLGLPGKSVSLTRSRRGKPILDASIHSEDLQFSMAKSGDRVLVGFSSATRLGVDLEPSARRAGNPLGVARRYFSDAEAEALAAMREQDLDAAFMRTWACKEAVVKASGQGIANQLCRFTVETDLSRPVSMLAIDEGDPGEWSLELLRPEPGFIAAVAARNSAVRIEPFRLLPASAPR